MNILKKNPLFIICMCLLCFNAFSQIKLKYNSEKIDTGYMYAYHYSINPNNFVPEDTVRYLYIIAGNTVETLSVSLSDTKQSVSFLKGIMDWQYFTLLYRETKNFVSSDYSMAPGEIRTVKSVVSRNFKKSVEQYEIFNSYSDRPATISDPVRSVGKRDIEGNSIPEYSMNGGIPVDFWLASRFFDQNKNSVINVERSGYSLQAKVKPDNIETVKYNGHTFRCKKYEIAPKGIIGMLFGKKGYIWVDADSKYRYLVKIRNENNPLHELILAERRPMSRNEWESFKNNIIEKVRGE